jgi:hypothetical protein
MKACSNCGFQKAPEAFYRRGTGRQNKCIECSKVAAKDWYAANPDYRREKAREWRAENPDYVRGYRKDNRRRIYLVESARKYGITTEQFDEMWASQNGSCATCRKLFDWSIKQTKPHIDHCHTTGRVRGLLCNACNSVLGIVNENADVLSALIGYLECHGSSAEQ